MIAGICKKCDGAIALGTTQHLDRDKCGDPAYPVIRLNPTGKETFDDMFTNALKAMKQRKP